MARKIVQLAIGQKGTAERMGEAAVAETYPIIYAVDDEGLAWRFVNEFQSWNPLPALPADVPKRVD